jgi:hypothetical protein
VQEHKELLSSLSFLEKTKPIQEFLSQRESSTEGIQFQSQGIGLYYMLEES